MIFSCLAMWLAAVLVLSSPALAQRDAWELLGEERVGFGDDRDVINLGHSEDFYRNKAYLRLRFVVEGGDLRMRSIRLVYLNDHSEAIDVNRSLRSGEQYDIDLNGERSYIQRIEMTYAGRPTLSIGPGGIKFGQAIVRVFGENARWAAPPQPPRPSDIDHGWVEIGRETFDRQNQTAVIEVGQGAGRFRQIRIRNDGESITLRELVIQFRNGETQRVSIDQELDGGHETPRIDLEGERRGISQISFMMEPRRRPGPATVVVLGTDRPGREERGNLGQGKRPQWVVLGEQTVGFTVDRDVIRVGHSEDWYRNRSFGRLHFGVANNDIHLLSIEIVYLNGFTERYSLDQLLRAGTELPVDLRGGRSFIREIAMTYRTRPGFGGRALVTVYGEPG